MITHLYDCSINSIVFTSKIKKKKEMRSMLKYSSDMFIFRISIKRTFYMIYITTSINYALYYNKTQNFMVV